MNYQDRLQSMIDYRFYQQREPAVIVDYSIDGKLLILNLSFIGKNAIAFSRTCTLSGFVPTTGLIVKYDRYTNSIS